MYPSRLKNQTQTVLKYHWAKETFLSCKTEQWAPSHGLIGMNRTLFLSKNIAIYYICYGLLFEKKKSIGWYKVYTAEQGMGKIRTQGTNVPNSYN